MPAAAIAASKNMDRRNLPHLTLTFFLAALIVLRRITLRTSL